MNCKHNWDVWVPTRDGYDPRGAFEIDGKAYGYKRECRIMGCSATQFAETVIPTGPLLTKEDVSLL